MEGEPAKYFHWVVAQAISFPFKLFSIDALSCIECSRSTCLLWLREGLPIVKIVLQLIAGGTTTLFVAEIAFGIEIWEYFILESGESCLWWRSS